MNNMIQNIFILISFAFNLLITKHFCSIFIEQFTNNYVRCNTRKHTLNKSRFENIVINTYQTWALQLFVRTFPLRKVNVGKTSNDNIYLSFHLII